MWTLRSFVTGRLANRDWLVASQASSPSADESGRKHNDAAPLIVHIIYRFDVGGLENGLVNLINHMPAGRYRHTVVCLTETTDFQHRLHDSSVPVFALHKRSGKDIFHYWKLWRLLRALRPTIVHTRNLGTLDCCIIAFLANVPHRLHGEHGWDMVDLHGASRKYKLLRCVCRPFISRYVVVSRDLNSWLKSRVGVPERKRVQIPNGVDTNRFNPAIRHESSGLSGFVSPNRIVIGSVGRMQEVKDPLTLVRAFLVLVNCLPDIRQRLRLVMIGDGPLRAEALTLLERAGSSASAWLPGARDDVAELLRTFDVFVLPSLNEGVSNTILEAMATGLPVVATRVGGNPELVIDGCSGVLVPPSDSAALARALHTYAVNPKLRRNHGQAGRRRVEQDFSLKAMVRDYLNLYDSALGRIAERSAHTKTSG